MDHVYILFRWHFLQGKPFRRVELDWKNTQKTPSIFASCKGQPIFFLNYFVYGYPKILQNCTGRIYPTVSWSQPKKYALRRSESYEPQLLTKLMVLKPLWWPCRETSFIFQEKPQYSTQLPIPDLESSHTGCPVIQAQYTLARSSNNKMKKKTENWRGKIMRLYCREKNRSGCYQGWRSGIYIRN